MTGWTPSQRQRWSANDVLHPLHPSDALVWWPADVSAPPPCATDRPVAVRRCRLRSGAS